MLEITIPSVELWDESKQEFVVTKEATLKLEHSLVSLSKWESKWCKPFISKEPKTRDETIDYIKFMTLNKNVDPEVYEYINQDTIDKIDAYIDSPMTATKISKQNRSGGGNIGEQVTAELIYYWMIALNIPFECQKWHLNKLITLIQVCNIKNTPPKKMGKRDVMSQNRALNAARRKRFNSKG